MTAASGDEEVQVTLVNADVVPVERSELIEDLGVEHGGAG